MEIMIMSIVLIGFIGTGAAIVAGEISNEQL